MTIRNLPTIVMQKLEFHRDVQTTWCHGDPSTTLRVTQVGTCGYERVRLSGDEARTTKLVLCLLLIAPLLVPISASANGGIKQVAEGKYLVNLSLAPIAPYVGEKQSMLIGFADIQGNLIQEDISVDLSLRHHREPILERENLLAENGVLPFAYTYDDPGLYELFVSFRLPQEPDHTYMPEDFMIDVKESRDTPSRNFAIPLIFGALLVGFFLGRCFPPCSSSPKPHGMH